MEYEQYEERLTFICIIILPTLCVLEEANVYNSIGGTACIWNGNID